MPQAPSAVQALEDALAEQDRHARVLLRMLDGYERSLGDLDAQLLPLVEAASRAGGRAENLAALRREADSMARARALLSRALRTCTVGGDAYALPPGFRKTALPRALFALFAARAYLLQRYPRVVQAEVSEAEARLALVSPTVQPYISPGCRPLFRAQLPGREILGTLLRRASRGLLAVTPAGQTADQPGQAVADAVAALSGSGPAGERYSARGLVEASWGLLHQFLEFSHLSPYAPVSMVCDTLAQASGARAPALGEAARAALLQDPGARGPGGGPGGWPPFSLAAFTAEGLLSPAEGAAGVAAAGAGAGAFASPGSSPDSADPGAQIFTSPAPGAEELFRDYPIPSPEAADDQFTVLNSLVPLVSLPPAFVDCLAQYLEERRRGLLSSFTDVVVAGPCLSPRDATALKEVSALTMESKLNDFVRNCLTNFLAQLPGELAAPTDKLPDPQAIMRAVRFQEVALSDSLGAKATLARMEKARGFSSETTYLAYGRTLLAQRREALLKERAKERRKAIQARDVRSQARPSRSKYQPGSHPFLVYLVCMVRNLLTERQYLIRLFSSILCYAYQEEPEPGFLLPENFPARRPGVFYSMCRLADACYQVIFYPAVRYVAQVGLDLARAMAESGEVCLMGAMDLVQGINALLPVLMFTGFTELAGLSVGGLPLEYCPVANAFELVTPDSNSPGSKSAVFVNGLGFVPETYTQAGADDSAPRDTGSAAVPSSVRQSARWTGKFDPLALSGSQGVATSTFSFDPDELLQAQCEDDYVPLNAGAVVSAPGGPQGAAGAQDDAERAQAEAWAQDPAMAVNPFLLALLSAQARTERGFEEDASSPMLSQTLPKARLGAAGEALAYGGLSPQPGTGQDWAQNLLAFNPECVDFYKAFSEPLAHKPAFALTALDLGRRELLYMCYVMSRAAFNLHNKFEATLFQVRTRVPDSNVHEQVPVILNKLEQMLSYTQGAALVPRQVSRGELVTQEVIDSLEDQDAQEKEGAADTPEGGAAEPARPAMAPPLATSGASSVFIRDANTGGEMLSPVPVAGPKAGHDDRAAPDFFSLDPYLAPQKAPSALSSLGPGQVLGPLAYECKIYYLACLLVYRVQPLRHPSQTYIFRINTLNYIYEYVSNSSNELSTAVSFDFREFLRHQIDKLIKLYIQRVWMPALTSLDVEALCGAIEHVYTKWYQQGSMGVTKEDYEHTMARVESSRAACRRGRARFDYVDPEAGEGDLETSVGAYADDPALGGDADGPEDEAGAPQPAPGGPGLTAEALGAAGGAESAAGSSRDSDATSDALTSVAPVRQNTPKIMVPKSKRIQGIMSVALPKFDKTVRPLIEQHREMFVSSGAVQERLRGYIQEAVVEPYKQYYAVCEMSAATSRYLQKYSSISASDLERAVGAFFR